MDSLSNRTTPIAVGTSPRRSDATVVLGFLGDGSAGDAPDPASCIIRHDNRPIRQFLDINRASNAAQKALSVAGAVAAHTQPHDLVPDRRAAIPAPVFGNQRFAAQLRKHGTAIEVKPERGHMGLKLIRGWGLWRGRSCRWTGCGRRSWSRLIWRSKRGCWVSCRRSSKD